MFCSVCKTELIRGEKFKGEAIDLVTFIDNKWVCPNHYAVLGQRW